MELSPAEYGFAGFCVAGIIGLFGYYIRLTRDFQEKMEQRTYDQGEQFRQTVEGIASLHREERSEWREASDKAAAARDAVIDKLDNTIREIITKRD